MITGPSRADKRPRLPAKPIEQRPPPERDLPHNRQAAVPKDEPVLLGVPPPPSTGDVEPGVKKDTGAQAPESVVKLGDGVQRLTPGEAGRAEAGVAAEVLGLGGVVGGSFAVTGAVQFSAG